MSFSDRIRYSTSSTLYSVPLYLANSTLSPALRFIGTRRPLSSRRPSPTARTVPSIGRSLLAVSGRKIPPLVCASRSAGLTTTRSARGRMRKSATIVVIPPCRRTNTVRGRTHPVTYCRVNATALLWRYSTPVEHPSSMASLQRPFGPKPEAIGGHMRRIAHDSEPFTWRKVSRQNPQSSVCNVQKPGAPAIAGIVPSHDGDDPPQEQVYHKSTFLAIGSRKWRLPIDQRTPFVPPPRASSAHLKVAVSARRFL